MRAIGNDNFVVVAIIRVDLPLQHSIYEKQRKIHFLLGT
jgi:hypothetical protein